MSTSTTNYGLTKPAAGENYSRAVLNNNWDLIDSAIKVESEKVKHAEMVRIAQNDAPAGTFWGPGNISAPYSAGPPTNGVEEAPSKNYADWLQSAYGNDKIRLTKEGIYDIVWSMTNKSGATISLWHIMCSDGSSPAQANATPFGRSPTFNVPAGDPYYAYAPGIYVPPAGLDVFFKYVIGTSNQPWDHRVKVTKVQ